MNSKTFSKKAIRHGEVMIIPIDELPEGLEQIHSGREYIVGHSETGHHHVAVGTLPDAITAYRPAGADSQYLYLKVTSKSVIEHRKTTEKHETKTLHPGIYKVSIKNN